ncbi:hypothetical protein HHS34_005310 [Acidithiobacillus montserratensis]|uniref:Uncharacterized protein n=1 Tax=Acidithiobacillus montserratensis TaxID=2729135 RepID=A0ACD5HI67_9PROT|nr:hypothetical protein [Acidithiobacillus montserratensis]MBU2746584.1 hypothetical protein [Acidithiobacillus montserratensis]
MASKVDPQLLKRAGSWACWVLGSTDMPKPKALRTASEKFGVSMAAIERYVIDTMGKEWLTDRGRRMSRQYGPPVASGQFSKVDVLMRQSAQTYKQMFRR